MDEIIHVNDSVTRFQPCVKHQSQSESILITTALISESTLENEKHLSSNKYLHEIQNISDQI